MRDVDLPVDGVIVETTDLVANVAPALVTRLRWRARRRAAKLNARRTLLSYRYEVVHDGRKYSVVAFQNVAFPTPKAGGLRPEP
jgi:hypothetical protein